jgi:hypothetical protein
MEQRGQVLELAAPRTVLEHPAAVAAAAVRDEVVVGVELFNEAVYWLRG